jgi:hypothetical protein
MGSAQIIAVALADTIDIRALLPGDASIAIYRVDDFEEARELAPVLDAALILSSAAAVGLDPLSLADIAPLLTVFTEGASPRARIYAKLPSSSERIVMGPSREHLPAVLSALLEKGASVVRVDLPDNAALKRRLVDIGVNGLVKAAAGDTSVQTELHMLGNRAVLRSTAFRAGQIALSRRFLIGFAASPVEEARWLAEEIHRETCALVAGETTSGGS